MSQATPWREPVQSRGRKRVEAILEATRAIIAGEGLIAVRMTDVAKRAGIPIGSLYQFFPTRSALLSRLFEEELAPVDRMFREELAEIDGLENLGEQIVDIAIRTFRLMEQRPCLPVVWSAAGSDPSIDDADLRSTFENANILAKSLRAFVEDDLDEESLRAFSVTVCHSYSAMVRLAFRVGDPEFSRSLMIQFGLLIHGRLMNMIGSERAVG